MTTKHRAVAGDGEIEIIITYVSMEGEEAERLVERMMFHTTKEAKECAQISIHESIALLTRLGESGKFDMVVKHLLDEIEDLKKISNEIFNLK